MPEDFRDVPLTTKYGLACLSHDPGLLISFGERTLDDAIDPLRREHGKLKSHPECDIVGYRMEGNGGPIQLFCLGTDVCAGSPRGCVHVPAPGITGETLRLVWAAHEKVDQTFIDAAASRCWPRDRVSILRHVLGFSEHGLVDGLEPYTGKHVRD